MLLNEKWNGIYIYAISRNTNGPNVGKWQKKRSFGSDFGPFAQIRAINFCFQNKNLALSVTGNHGQLSSCTISEKTNDPILRKLSDGRNKGRTDGRK